MYVMMCFITPSQEIITIHILNLPYNFKLYGKHGQERERHYRALCMQSMAILWVLSYLYTTHMHRIDTQ